MFGITVTLFESLLYMVTLTVTCGAVAFLLYWGVKSGGIAKSKGLALGPITMSFELTGGIAGFIVMLVIWLLALPPSKILPEVMVYSVKGDVDLSQFTDDERSRLTEGFSFAVTPSGRLLPTGKIHGLYLVAAKDPATKKWEIPSIKISPKGPLSDRFFAIDLSVNRPDFSGGQNTLSIDGRTLHTTGELVFPVKTLGLAGGG
ncbi:MAG: hypothetical protein ACR2PG_03090 [Hyphomicrobiaceae bacterium]